MAQHDHVHCQANTFSAMTCIPGPVGPNNASLHRISQLTSSSTMPLDPMPIPSGPRTSIPGHVRPDHVTFHHFYTGGPTHSDPMSGPTCVLQRHCTCFCSIWRTISPPVNHKMDHVPGLESTLRSLLGLLTHTIGPRHA